MTVTCRNVGKNVFVTNPYDTPGSVAAFTIAPTTGALTRGRGSPYLPAEDQPYGLLWTLAEAIYMSQMHKFHRTSRPSARCGRRADSGCVDSDYRFAYQRVVWGGDVQVGLEYIRIRQQLRYRQVGTLEAFTSTLGVLRR